MKIISFEDIKSLNISPIKCYEWVSEMIENKKNAFLPPKVHMSMPGNIFCNVMPCLVEDTGFSVGGVKMVTRYPERTPSLDSKILLFDSKSGEFLALMDGNWITAMRTGAVAAHSVMHLARSDWSTVGMVGLGNVARASLLSLASISSDKHMVIKLLKYKNQAELFVERFIGYPNLEFQIVDTVQDCISDSDVVISCATYFEDDISLDEWFKEGVLVVPVHTRGFTNCDLFFDKVYADDTGHVDHFKNFSRFRYYAEMTDVVNKKAVGRENNAERILAYNIGVSVHDVNYAAKIYQMLERDQRLFSGLPDAAMHTPVEKFWI